jgi:hypothetical protein
MLKQSLRDEIPDEYIDQGDKSETESSCPSSVLGHKGSLGTQVNASLRKDELQIG